MKEEEIYKNHSIVKNVWRKLLKKVEVKIHISKLKWSKGIVWVNDYAHWKGIKFQNHKSFPVNFNNPGGSVRVSALLFLWYCFGVSLHFSYFYFIDAVLVNTTTHNRCKVNEEINKVSNFHGLQLVGFEHFARALSLLSHTHKRTHARQSCQFMQNGRFVGCSREDDIIKSKQIKNKKVNYWCMWKKESMHHECRVFIAFILCSFDRIVY